MLSFPLPYAHVLNHTRIYIETIIHCLPLETLLSSSPHFHTLKFANGEGILPNQILSFYFHLYSIFNNVPLYTSNPVLYPPQHHPVEPARYTWHPTHTLLGLMHPLAQISFSTTPSSPIFPLCGRSHPNSQSLQGWPTLRVTRALIRFPSDHPEPATTTLRCPMMRCLPRA